MDEKLDRAQEETPEVCERDCVCEWKETSRERKEGGHAARSSPR